MYPNQKRALIVFVVVVAAFVGVLIFQSRDTSQPSSVTKTEPSNTKYTDCVDEATRRLESIGVEFMQAITQAENSPRCLPLK